SGVTIEASNARAGKFLAQALFEMLRAFTEEVDVFGLALGALLRHRLNGAAVVAFETIAVLVVGHRDAAVLALDGGAATATQDGPGVAAAIDQDQRLGLVGQAFLDAGVECGADWAGLVSTLEVLPEIDDFDGGESTIGNARGESEEFIFAGSRVMERLHRRSGGAEQRDGVFHLGANDGDVAAVVARRFLLLVAGFLLFVDDDEAEIFERGENGGAG